MIKTIVRREPKPGAQFPLGFPEILRRVYASRGVMSEEELSYELKHLQKPRLKGLTEALDLLQMALEQQEKILIVGDFDADGATSTAVAVRCLRAMGARRVDYIVPNRFEYGYGLTPEIVDVAAERQPDLIITVDNGVASFDGVKRAKALGIKVLVTDHHLPAETLPDADALVNPNQHGCPFPSKAAAGVGVIFYVMMALRSRLRSLNWFHEALPEPNLAIHLDIVALGTVADVVPLDYNNRILVDQGLKRMRAGQACLGIKALLQVAGRSIEEIQASDLGFVAGPRLNAAGRLDDMSLGIKCLLADNNSDALMLARELDALNRDRRSIENSMQVEANRWLEKLEQKEQTLPAGICLYQADWHQGVIGIVASRVKDKMHRPVVVFADDGNGQLKGSGRSINGIHLRDVLDEIATKTPGLLTKFGGHAMAAGMSLEKNKLDQFTQIFAETVESHLGPKGLEPLIETDGPLTESELTLAFAGLLQKGGPWGQSFPEPSFDGEFEIINQKIVGEKHLKLVLAMGGDPNQIFDGIAFNVDLEAWPNHRAHKVKLVYKLGINEFRGNRTVQLMVDYLEAL